MLRLFNFVLFVVVVFSLASMLPKAAVDPDGAGRVLGQSVRVLETYQVNGKGSLTRDQMAMVDSPTFRAWLDQHCVKDGSVPAWRIVPSDGQFNSDQPEFAKLMAEPRSGDNWLYISNDKKVLSSTPLPASESAAETLIGKFAR